MAWIKTIGYNEADDDLKRVYDRVKGPENNIDNVLLIHSLRPHSLIGHMALVKSYFGSFREVLDSELAQ